MSQIDFAALPSQIQGSCSSRAAVMEGFLQLPPSCRPPPQLGTFQSYRNFLQLEASWNSSAHCPCSLGPQVFLASGVFGPFLSLQTLHLDSGLLLSQHQSTFKIVRCLQAKSDLCLPANISYELNDYCSSACDTNVLWPVHCTSAHVHSLAINVNVNPPETSRIRGFAAILQQSDSAV